MLGEVSAKVGVLILGKEFVVVYVGDWSLRRGEVALLCEEAGLARCVDLGCRSSRRIGSRPPARGSRGREGKVNGIGKKAMYRLLLVMLLHIVAVGGAGLCDFGHSQEL